MNSRKNPSLAGLILTSLLACLSMTGCSSLFRHGDSGEKEEKAAERPANSYSATEDGSEDLKDKKIQSLESTVTTLNTRIQELEGKLQAVQNPPALDPRFGKPETSEKTERQNSGGIHASIAASDPGAGFVNDANVRSFQQGKILFDQEKYPEAVLAFSAFLERNGKHTLASNAQYYIGESYFRQGDTTVADQEFQKLILRYPNSARVSYGLVRLAECADKNGKPDEARRYRMQAQGLYAKSPALRGTNVGGAAVGGTALRETVPAKTAVLPAEPAAAAAGANTIPPIATAPESPNEISNTPSLPIEKPVPPVAPRVITGDGDLDAPPGASN